MDLVDKDGFAKLPDHLVKQFQHRAYASIGLPKKYFDKTLDEFSLTQDAIGQDLAEEDAQRKKKAKKVIVKYIESLSAIMAGEDLFLSFKSKEITAKNILLYGGPASGKTMLLSIIMKEAIKLSRRIRYVNWAPFVGTLSRYDKKDEIDHFNEVFTTYDLIAIDNIAKMHLNDFATMHLDVLLSNRSNQNKPTIFGSYIVPNEFMSMLGASSQRYVMDSFVINLPSAKQGQFMEVN